jgi:phage terminase small subunit
LARRLNPRQKKFVREYLISGNAADAFRKAGYKARQPYSEASRMLKHNEAVKEYLAAREQAISEKYSVTEERILRELGAIGFGNAGRLFEWDKNSVSFIPKDEIDPEDMKFVESISETVTEHGSSFKMTTLGNQKVRALEAIARIAGIDKKKNSDSDPTSIKLSYNVDEEPVKP